MNLFGAAAKTIDKFNLAISEDFTLDEKLNKEQERLIFFNFFNSTKIPN